MISFPPSEKNKVTKLFFDFWREYSNGRIEFTSKIAKILVEKSRENTTERKIRGNRRPPAGQCTKSAVYSKYERREIQKSFVNTLLQCRIGLPQRKRSTLRRLAEAAF